jgi:hypothetical protein
VWFTGIHQHCKQLTEITLLDIRGEILLDGFVTSTEDGASNSAGDPTKSAFELLSKSLDKQGSVQDTYRRPRFLSINELIEAFKALNIDSQTVFIEWSTKECDITMLHCAFTDAGHPNLINRNNTMSALKAWRRAPP